MEWKAKMGIVGKKYDLYPPKEIREELGLKPGQKVLYRVETGKLVIEVIPSIEEAEKLPKFAETSVEEFENFTRETEKKTFEKIRKEIEK